MTQLITADEAREALSPHLDTISSSLTKGWKRWIDLLKKDSELGVIVSDRSRASLVNDFIRHEATQAFDSAKDVVISNSRGFLLLTFGERVVLRFKKFRGENLRTSSNRTKQSEDYAQQALPGMTELTHLVAGYLPDDSGLGLAVTAITCSLADDQKWVIDLDLATSEDTATTKPLPSIPSQKTAVTIVRPKHAESDEGTGQTAQDER